MIGERIIIKITVKAHCFGSFDQLFPIFFCQQKGNENEIEGGINQDAEWASVFLSFKNNSVYQTPS